MYSAGFEEDVFPPDGFVGLAFPALSMFGENDFFSTLVNEG
jgi:cathepsin D